MYIIHMKNESLQLVLQRTKTWMLCKKEKWEGSDKVDDDGGAGDGHASRVAALDVAEAHVDVTPVQRDS